MNNPIDFTRSLREQGHTQVPASSPAPADNRANDSAIVQREVTAPLSDGAAARDIKLSVVRPDPNQPRKTIDPDKLEELAASIRENGLLQPITVTWSQNDGCYLIVTGQRRYEAAKRAGLTSIPAIIKPSTHDQGARLQQQLVENIQREGIPPVEEARAVSTLMDTFELSQRAVAKRLGKPQTYIAELLQILRLPDAALARAASLPKNVLIQASRAKDRDEQLHLIDAALTSHATVEQLRANRSGRKPSSRYERFTKTFEVEAVAGQLTIRFDRPPADVSTEDIIQFITQVLHTLLNHPRG